MTNLDTAAIASLILTTLVADDAITARELAAAIGLTTAALRPALRQLVAAGAVTTSGRTSGTRYVLAVEEQLEPELPSCVVAMQCLCAGHAAGLPAAAPCDTSERHFVAPEPPGTRRCRPARRSRPAIPATVDLLGDLERTAESLASGATLHELSARPVACA
jgi:hypothetical protein